MMQDYETETQDNIILDLVEQQLTENDPIEVQHTLNRLMSEGRSRDQAVQLIGYAFSIELMEMIKHDQKLNHSRYSHNLDRLPTLPWE